MTVKGTCERRTGMRKMLSRSPTFGEAQQVNVQENRCRVTGVLDPTIEMQPAADMIEHKETYGD
jgi:hypothetical protein